MAEIRNLYPSFLTLFDDIPKDHDFQNNPQLLAHYTTLGVLEAMLKNDEVWFSNPLLMNDIQETTVALNDGMRAFLASPAIRQSFALKEDLDLFEQALNANYNRFFQEHRFDTYILCLSEHRAADMDGRLSMWRGYGDAGKGVAVVFDATQVPRVETSPLLLSKIWYASLEERLDWYRAASHNISVIIQRERPTGNEIWVAAEVLFARLRMFALFTKHKGFEEEQEWRMAYLPERDPAGALKPYLSYHNGPRGVEPKLKLKMSSKDTFGVEISSDVLINRIILGPNSQSPLALLSAKRMLEATKRGALIGRLVASTIPYRQ